MQFSGIHSGTSVATFRRSWAVLPGGVFAVSKLLPADEVQQLMIEAARKSYGKKGEKIVRMNEGGRIPVRIGEESGDGKGVSPLIRDRLLDSCQQTG